MIVGLGIAAEGVNVTQHTPDERVQDVGENVPLFEADQLTVPVGDFPLTTSVQVVETPTFGAEGEQETMLFPLRLLSTAKVYVPELGRFWESPE